MAGRAWGGWPFVILAAAAAGLVVAESRLAGLVIVSDGVIALGVLAAAAGGGLWLVRLLRLHDQPFAWQLLLAAGLGVGCLSLVVLVFGLSGLLFRGLWIGLLAAMGLAGSVRLARMARAGPLCVPARDPSQGLRRADRANWLWLLVPPMLACTLLVATVPPGLLWRGEAGGYDVLEYHLGVPKEYFQEGRILFLRHNLYSNMPLNAEMLSLLAMVLKGQVWDAVFLAQLLNAGLAILAVAAIWLAGAELSRSAGLLAGVLAGLCPWLTYLSGVAYVENGMLLQTALVLAVLLRWWRHRHEPDAWRWAAAAGLLAGLACGYKYTAVLLVAAPALAAVLMMTLSGRPRRPAVAMLFVLCGLITFSPWMAKNLRMTGNPVFPLAYRVFGARPYVWNDALAERWRLAHQPPESARSIPGWLPALHEAVSGRLAALHEAVLRNPLYGRYVPFLLAVPILLSPRRQGADWLAALFVVGGLGLWMGCTHLVDRFAVPILPGLMVLAGRAWSAWRFRPYRALVAGGLLVSCLLNVSYMGSLYFNQVPRGDFRPFGRVDAFLASHWANQLPPNARVMLIAEARAFYIQRPVSYTVVFSPNRLAELVAGGAGPAELLNLLGLQGYTHLFVHWAEMDRLRGTYGFWPQIDRSLIQRLQGAGLVWREDFFDRRNVPYASLYEVPRP